MTKLLLKLILLALLFSTLSITILAQKAKKAKVVPEPQLMDSLKACKKYEGLFTIFQDTTNGTTYILIKQEQFQKEYIYFGHVVNGVSNFRLVKGSFLDNKIFSIKKYFDKIEFITENNSFYYDEKNALSKSKDANISIGVIASQKIIVSDSSKKSFLIKADDIFLSELFQQIKPSPNPSENKDNPQFNLGALNRDKTKYVKIKNYPLNTDVEVEYVYENLYPVVYGDASIADSRFISINIQHSLIEMPKNNFKPRYDDPRIGYFTTEVTDMTSTSVTPYKDLIHRWNLEKKDKNAALSEPIEPIVWWIENTTPVEFRNIIQNAALAWNEAFETAGFKNAMVVKIQPDDANWDAGDIRYNVLRWTSSPNPPFGGYGPSFVNPRTGQIIGADIMLEYVYFTNRVKLEKLFTTYGLESDVDVEKFDQHKCFYGDNLHHNNLFGLAVLKATDMPEPEKHELLKQALTGLVLHELGHTLGLNHNMKASQLFSPDSINNKELTSKIGLTGSVMDYAPINLALDKSLQGLYYDTKPGPYDKWAIEFGYSQSLDNPESENNRLQKILSRSTNPELCFGNDADDMRSPGGGIDPRVMVDDLSSDAIKYSINRINLVNKIADNIKAKYSIEGQSYHELRNAYLILTREYFNAANVITRYIGGVYVNRAFVGQDKISKPLMPVNYKDQKRAMDALSKYAFSVDVFKTSNDLYNYLQQQRRGFNFFGSNEDPKIHDRVLNIQKSLLNQLLHINVLKRIIDTRLYGNEYSLSEFMSDMTNAIFQDDLKNNVNTFRQNLQLEYLKRLIEIVGFETPSNYDSQAQSLAFNQIKNIQKILTENIGLNNETKTHRQFLLFKIQKAMEKR